VITFSCVNSTEKKEHLKYRFLFSRSFEPEITFTFDKLSEELFVVKTGNYRDDTLSQQTFHFPRETMEQFFDEIQNIPYNNDTLNINGEMMLDGRAIYLMKTSKFDTSYVVSRNSTRNINSEFNFENDYNMLDIFFKTVNNNISDSGLTTSLKQLYNSYGCKLAFKKTSTSPLEYSVWGAMSDNIKENDNLIFINFISTLPKEEPVIIELNELMYSIDTSFQNKRTNLYFYKDSQLEYLNRPIYYGNEIKDSIIFNRRIKKHTEEVLLSKKCTSTSPCQFEKSHFIFHFSYHYWLDCKENLTKQLGNYYSSRSKILNELTQ